MFRLIMAIGVAAMLMPNNLETVVKTDASLGKQAMPQVSTLDTLNAAGSVVEDIASFCERNVEACETGKAIASNVFSYAQTALASLSETQPVQKQMKAVDEVVTGSTHPSN